MMIKVGTIIILGLFGLSIWGWQHENQTKADLIEKLQGVKVTPYEASLITITVGRSNWWQNVSS